MHDAPHGGRPAPEVPPPAPVRGGGISPLLAGALTFLASACVLVLEIAAARLLAPYVGVSLTTYTAIIGIILAGIAAGAWTGGRLADALPPEPMVGPAIALGGVAAIASVPIVAMLGEGLSGGGAASSVLLAGVGFVLPAAILSAAAPMLVRATIRDVATSGGLVGRLSAIGTVGALTGTFLTGFILLGLVPTRALVIGTGVILVLVGIVVAWRHRRGAASAGTLLALVVSAGAMTGVAAASPSPCERESAYYCIAVREDAGDPSRRTLVLDNLRHAFVDLDDPTAIEFAYIRWFREAASDVTTPRRGPMPTVEAVHIGGGGFAFPRYLRAVLPASQHVVLELDPVVLEVARAELGFVPDPFVEVRLGDARGTLATVSDDAADLVVGDAFGGLSVPWHLMTRELVADVDRVLRPGGRYVLNVIDGPSLLLVRAQVATLRERFEHVAVITWREAFAGRGGGNAVIVASHLAFDAADLRERIEAGDPTATLIAGTEVESFAATAPVLTDDFAPADQLIGR